MKSRFYQRPYQLEKPAECVPLSPDISSLLFFFWNLLNEDTYTEGFKTIKEMRTPSYSEVGHPHSQIGTKSLADPGTIRLPAVTLRKKAQTGPFTLNAADGQPRIGMINDIKILLCHFIGNHVIHHFWKCDDKHKNH